MRRLIIKLIFVVIAVIIVATSVGSRRDENQYVVTDLRGTVHVQIQTRHTLDTPANGQKTAPGQERVYVKPSQWIALRAGDTLGPGDVVRTQSASMVDLMPTSGMGVRVDADSLVRIDRKEEGSYPFMEVAINTGKVMIKALSDKIQGYRRGTEMLKVKTPVATAGIRGTTFSVDFNPATKFSTVGVLEGTVNVRSVESPDAGVNVPADQMTRVTRFSRFPALAPLEPDLRTALQQVENIKLDHSMMEELTRILNVKANALDPTYNRILRMIAEYEMRVFVKAVHSLAPLRWEGNVPPTLRAVPLQEGDYLDPWDTQYYYEAVDAKTGVLISAGPDKQLHSRDDIFLAITM